MESLLAEVRLLTTDRHGYPAVGTQQVTRRKYAPMEGVPEQILGVQINLLGCTKRKRPTHFGGARKAPFFHKRS